MKDMLSIPTSEWIWFDWCLLVAIGLRREEGIVHMKSTNVYFEEMPIETNVGGEFNTI